MVEALGAHLSGSDFTSLMLEIIRRRAAAVTPRDVLHRYQNDRFTRPSSLDPLKLCEMQLAALRAVALPGCMKFGW